MTSFEKAFGCVRIALGWIFLWAFADKTAGFGFSTVPSEAWTIGHSPTAGFLMNGTKGPFADFFQSLAGSAVVDWLFMLGLLFVGTTIFLGIMVRLGAVAGILLMALIYGAGMPPSANPVVDQHIIYILVFTAMLFAPVGAWYGYGTWWTEFRLVRKNPWLH